MKSFIYRGIAGFALTTLTFTTWAAAQSLAEKEQANEGSGMTYLLVFVALAGAAAAIYFWQRSKGGSNKPDLNYENRYQNYYSKNGSEGGSADAAKELEWLRKSKGSGTKFRGTAVDRRKPTTRRTKITATNSAGIDEATLDTTAFQEKMRKMQYTQLPINTITELSPASYFDALPVSDDESLLNAIDQANEEFEEDVEVRELALRILAAFRTRNSVDSLSQIALYDLAATVRSKAVAALTDFDHESVFESILLACADPTREVRATAARGLFRLNFDRADAWKRIIETRDGFRMRHAARAALEAGIVNKAFERLIHDDLKITYEAVVLVALMIRAGELTAIFEAIRGHKDERVRYALLHVLQIVPDERTVEPLAELAKEEDLPADVMTRVKTAVSSLEVVTA